ncbi:MAG TPA: hypothetical protein VF529_12710 [Solirubrobacteraceae bacterium]
MEIAALTSFLAPFLPKLLAAGEMLVAGALDEAGTDAWEHAKRLWGRLRGKVEGRPGAAEAAADAAARSDDPRALGALQLQLEKILAGDAQLAADVTALWEEAQRSGVVAAMGDRSVAISGDVRGSTLITGDQNTVSG